MQVKGISDSRLLLEVRRLGPLPILNSFLARLGLDELLAGTVPTSDARCSIEHAKALGVLLRTIVVEREPIYRHQETVSGFDSTLFGLGEVDVSRLTDDSLGRGLDCLFDADRTALVTKIVVALGKRFEVRFDQLHNDSTTIRLAGQYRAAGTDHPRPPRPVGDLRPLKGPPSRPETTAVHPHHHQGWRRSRAVPLRRRQHERRHHPHRYVG